MALSGLMAQLGGLYLPHSLCHINRFIAITAVDVAQFRFHSVSGHLVGEVVSVDSCHHVVHLVRNHMTRRSRSARVGILLEVLVEERAAEATWASLIVILAFSTLLSCEVHVESALQAEVAIIELRLVTLNVLDLLLLEYIATQVFRLVWILFKNITSFVNQHRPITAL